MGWWADWRATREEKRIDREMRASAREIRLAKKRGKRDRLNSIAASYGGATRTREASGWNVSSASADEEIRASLPILRDRMRQSVRDNPIQGKSLETLVDSIYGEGIFPKGLKAQRDIDLWNEYVDNADPEGKLDLYGLQQLEVRTVLESGECLVRYRRRRASDRMVIPVQKQVLEGDYLDETKNEALPNGRGWIKMGVEYTPIGRVRGFWVYPVHPGDMGVYRGTSRYQSVFVPASEMRHVFRVLRPGQSRGVPKAHSVLMKQRHLDDFETAELYGKKAQAAHFAVVETQSGAEDTFFGTHYEDETGASNSSDGEPRNEWFEIGGVVYLQNGEKVTLSTPPMAAGETDYVKRHNRSIASGWGVTYAQATGDLSETSYSSMRNGWTDYKRGVKSFQKHTAIRQICRPDWNRFVFYANGLRDGSFPVRPSGWTVPVIEEPDPIKFAQAQLLNVRAGFRTLQDVQGEYGTEFADWLKYTVEAMREIDKAGAVIDSDGRYVTRAGVAQFSDPRAFPFEDTSDEDPPDDEETEE